MKKILIFVVLLSITLPFTVLAEETTDNEQTTEIKLKTNTESDAKNSSENSEKNNTEEIGLKSNHYILMEANTGKVILSKNEDERLSPASITKIMTTLLIFESIEQGKIKLEDDVTTSAYAKSMGGSQVFLEEGEIQNVETMIKCILIASGNDASVAMAEKIAGSEESFVNMMNDKASELGMTNTHFEDCCGLTDSDNHYTSARDVAIMSKELVTKHPEVLDYSSIWMETIIHKTDKGEKEFVLSNTNKLLKASPYVKGLKTGSTSKAKYCVSNVAEKDDVTLISVVMAAPDYKTRFADSSKLLNYGFSKCKVFSDPESDFDLKTIGGTKENVKAKKQAAYYVDTEGIDFNQISKKNNVNEYINVPIKKGDVLGSVHYYYDGKEIAKADIVAMEDVEKANYTYELKHLFGLFLQLC